MKKILVLVLAYSAFQANSADLGINEEMIREIFDIESFEVQGEGQSGLIYSDDKPIGSYSIATSDERYIPSIPEIEMIKKIEYRDDLDPINIRWTTEAREEFETIYSILKNHSSIEIQRITYTIFSSSSKIEPEITSGRWCGCTDGLYFTDLNGDVYSIIGEIGQAEFEDGSQPDIDFDNLPLGLYLEERIENQSVHTTSASAPR